MSSMSSATLVERLAVWWRTRPRLLGEVRTSQEKALIEKWKAGIASALGVPREAIRDDVADQYLGQWVRLLVKPEYHKALGLEQEGKQGEKVEQGKQATSDAGKQEGKQSTQEKQEAPSKEAPSNRKAKKITREASSDGQRANGQRSRGLEGHN